MLTLGLGVLSNVFSQIFLPLQSFLFRYHTSDHSHASLPQLVTESLRRVVEVFEVNLRDDLGAKFDDCWDLFP
jgi:hypothetical protein